MPTKTVLEQEAIALRHDNKALRMKNTILEKQNASNEAELKKRERIVYLSILVREFPVDDTNTNEYFELKKRLNSALDSYTDRF